MCLDVITDAQDVLTPVMNKCEAPAPAKDHWQLWWPLFYKYETDPFVIRIRSMKDNTKYLYITKVLD